MAWLRVGLMGAGGYAGQELVRLLSNHPGVELTLVILRDDEPPSAVGRHVAAGPQGRPAAAGAQGRQASGGALATSRATPPSAPPAPRRAWPPAHWPPHLAHVASFIPVLRGLDPEVVAQRCDAVILSLPGGASARAALALRRVGVTVIDVGGDLRLKDYGEYVKWYGGDDPISEEDHASLMAEVVHGLPEFSAEAMAGAGLVSLPGCYPTAALLLLLPLLQGGWIGREGIVLHGASGVTGAGSSPGRAGLLAELSENVHPYKTGRHQHRPEIEQALSAVAGEPVRIAWTTHLLPMRRGLFVTATLPPGEGDPEAAPRALAEAYEDAPLVDVVPGEPETAWVRGTARAALALHWDGHAGRLVGYAAIDNLGKGAAAQAVQALNLVAGWPEDRGLEGAMAPC